MSKRIVVDMAMDSTGVADGANDAKRELERLENVVEDIGRDGARDVERLEDAFKDAQRAAERMDDSIDDVRGTTSKSMTKARENVAEFKDEAKQNFSEVASSFSGDMDSAVDLVQGTLGGLASSIPGIGLLAGGAAVAVGGIAATFQANDEAAEESRQRAAEWAQAYIDAGGRVLTSTITTAKALDVITDPEQFKKAEENAKNWGVSTSVAVAAMSGEAWALKAANDALSESERKVKEETDNIGIQYEELTDKLVEVSQQNFIGRDSLNQLNQEMKDGQQQASTWSDYLKQMASNTEGATSAVDEFGDTIVTLPDGKTIYIDAETKQATDDTQKIEDKIFSIPNKQVFVGVSASGIGDTERAVNDMVGRMSRKTINVRVNMQRDSGSKTWDG